MRNKKIKIIGFYALIILVVMQLTFAKSWDSTKPSHSTLYVDTLTGRSSTVITVDDVLNVTDTAGNDAKIIIDSARTKFSAIDFYRAGVGHWGIGMSQQDNFYIDRSGFGTIIFIHNNTKHVGINTTSPGDDMLRVAGNINASGDICTESNGGKCLGSITGGSDNDWVFVSGSNVIDPIYHTGNVSIGGNFLPVRPLHIRNNQDANIRLHDDIGNAAAYLEFYAGAGNGLRYGYIGLPGNGTNIELASENGGNITLKPAGNVIINGLVNCDTIDTDANGKLICGTDASGSSGGVGGSGTSGYIARWNGTSSVNSSVIYEGGGNVGIGIVPTGAKLDVNGNEYLRGNLTISGSIKADVSGNIIIEIG